VIDAASLIQTAATKLQSRYRGLAGRKKANLESNSQKAAASIQAAFDDAETMANKLPLFLRLFQRWTPRRLARYSQRYSKAEERKKRHSDWRLILDSTPRPLLESEGRARSNSFLSDHGSREDRLLGAFVDGRFDSNAAAVQNDMCNIWQCRAEGC
jgi:hypothetical protein